jgi:hypothetical protein
MADKCAVSGIIDKMRARCLAMPFSESRYKSHGAGDPIFGIQFTLRVNPNAAVPIIPNIGSRCCSGGQSWAYRLSENNMPVLQLEQYCKLFLGRHTIMIFLRALPPILWLQSSTADWPDPHRPCQRRFRDQRTFGQLAAPALY